MISRYLKNDIVIDGHEIKKGRDVMIFIYSIHHNPIDWKDPDTFNPDRFNEQIKPK